MVVSSLGDNLSIVIACAHVPHHDWMSFLCWYSISKNLPEATVVVACARGGEMNYDIFNWPRRSRVQLLHHNPALDVSTAVLGNKKSQATLPVLILEPNTVCIRDFDEAQFDASIFNNQQVFKAKDTPQLQTSCREENPSVFTDYADGWGKFVTSAWINKASTPLVAGNGYVKSSMTVNEMRIGKLWESAALSYQSMSRG